MMAQLKQVLLVTRFESKMLLRSWAFGNVDSAQREGPELAGFQIPHQCRKVLFQIGIKHVDAHLIHTRGPSIPLDRLEGLSHDRGRDPPGQRMHLDLLHGEPFMRCHHGVRAREPFEDVS